MDAAGQYSAAESITAEQYFGLDSPQSEHEQQWLGIGSSDGAHANFTPPERLGIDNTNVERGIRSILNWSQFPPSFPRPTTVSNFDDLMSGPRVSQGHTSVQGSSHLSVDTLQQHSWAVQPTLPWWGPSHLPSSWQPNIPVAPSQSAQPPQSSNQMTPKRTRKRSKNNNETNGSRRCNCKNSYCLKLYCECFSDGYYCNDSLCKCTHCLNNPDFEDTVQDFRKQIELRDPHAFGPKVVRQGNGYPVNTMREELNQTTPFLERHRRGCNCRKSNCVKKYCQCYEARVGCSQLCRCKSCANPFSTKARVKY